MFVYVYVCVRVRMCLYMSVCVWPRRHALRNDAGVTANPFCFEAIVVSVATAVPELGACVGCGVVVPPDQVVPACARVQGQDARRCGNNTETDERMNRWMGDGWMDDGWMDKCVGE